MRNIVSIIAFFMLSVMAYGQLDTIDIGLTPNNRKGDPIRTMGIKTNNAIKAINNAVEGADMSDIAVAKNDNVLHTLRAMGNSIIALPAAATTLQGSTYTMVDQNTYFVAFILYEADTITGVALTLSTAGVFTAADFNGVALYSVNENTATRVAISANDGNFWKSAQYTKVSVPFTSQYIAAAGVYYVAISYNNSAQTTAPVIYCSSDIGTAAYSMDRLNRRLSAMSNRTSLAATESISGLSFTSKVPYVWLY